MHKGSLIHGIYLHLSRRTSPVSNKSSGLILGKQPESEEPSLVHLHFKPKVAQVVSTVAILNRNRVLPGEPIKRPLRMFLSQKKRMISPVLCRMILLLTLSREPLRRTI